VRKLSSMVRQSLWGDSVVVMNYGGRTDVSTVDWSGKAVCVIFFRGCQMRCVYCHNYHLLEGKNLVDVSEIISYLSLAKNFVSGVVFCGGEPTLQKEPLLEISRAAKHMGLGVGLNTNGLRWQVINEMVEKGLLDFISLDVKAPLSKPELYGRICYSDERKCDVEKIRKALDIISNVKEAEVRTTIFTNLLTPEDIRLIADDIKNTSAVYVLQEGMSVKGRFEYRSPTPSEMMEYADAALDVLDRVVVRGREGEKIVGRKRV